MHRFFADLSRLLSRLTGGAPNTTLCHRAAMRWGWDCLFCRAVAAVLHDRDHCLDELSAAEIVARKRRAANLQSKAEIRTTTMKLIPNARAVLRKAWSIRLMVLAGLLSGLEVALPFLEGWLPVPTGTFAALSGITTAGAFYARLVAQKGITDADQ